MVRVWLVLWVGVMLLGCGGPERPARSVPDGASTPSAAGPGPSTERNIATH